MNRLHISTCFMNVVMKWSFEGQTKTGWVQFGKQGRKLQWSNMIGSMKFEKVL